MIKRPRLTERRTAPTTKDDLCKSGIGKRNQITQKRGRGTISRIEVRKSGHLESRILPESITLSEPTRKRTIKPHVTNRITDAIITGIDHCPNRTPFLLVDVRKVNSKSSKAARMAERKILVISLLRLMTAFCLLSVYHFHQNT